MSSFRGVCRSTRRVGGSIVQCDVTFTDRDEWTSHRRKVHKVSPARADRVLTDPVGFRAGPVLSRIVKRKPDPRPECGDYLLPDGDVESA